MSEKRKHDNVRLRELFRILQKDPTNDKAFDEFYEIAQPYCADCIYWRLQGWFGYRPDLKENVEDGCADVFCVLFCKIHQYDETRGEPLTWIESFAIRKSFEIKRKIDKDIVNCSISQDSGISKELQDINQGKDAIINKLDLEIIYDYICEILSELDDDLDAKIVLMKFKIPTGDPEIDKRIEVLKSVEHAQIADILNEVKKKQIPDWRNLSTNAVQKRYRNTLKILRNELPPSFINFTQ